MSNFYWASTEYDEVVFCGRNLNFLAKNGHQAESGNWISAINKIEVDVVADLHYEIAEMSKLIDESVSIMGGCWGIPKSRRNRKKKDYSDTSGDEQKLRLVTSGGVQNNGESKNSFCHHDVEGRNSYYEYFDSADNLIYCGISTNPFRRWAQHLRSKKWAREVIKIQIEWCDSRNIALGLEYNSIELYNPKYNLVGGTNAQDFIPYHLSDEYRQLKKSLSALIYNASASGAPLPFCIKGESRLEDIISSLRVEFGSLVCAGEAVWDAVCKQTNSYEPYPYSVRLQKAA